MVKLKLNFHATSKFALLVSRDCYKFVLISYCFDFLNKNIVSKNNNQFFPCFSSNILIQRHLQTQGLQSL